MSPEQKGNPFEKMRKHVDEVAKQPKDEKPGDAFKPLASEQADRSRTPRRRNWVDVVAEKLEEKEEKEIERWSKFRLPKSRQNRHEQN